MAADNGQMTIETISIDGNEIKISRTASSASWECGEKSGSIEHADPYGDEAKQIILADALEALNAA